MDLVTQPAFDWHSIVEIESLEASRPGRQIINFTPNDRHFSETPEGKDFVERYLKHAKALDTDAELLKYGSDQVTLKGLFLEMGVCTGKMINFLAALNPKQKIYGFDSFEGLPEDWTRKDVFIPKGTFKVKSNDFLPPVLHNVVIIKGLFRDSLPLFKEKILKDQPIAFLHIDCDIYASTKDVFDILGDHIVEGTIIVFDELYNYPGYDLHEFKAFEEFLTSSGKTSEYLAYNQFFEQVAVKIHQ